MIVDQGLHDYVTKPKLVYRRFSLTIVAICGFVGITRSGVCACKLAPTLWETTLANVHA